MLHGTKLKCAFQFRWLLVIDTLILISVQTITNLHGNARSRLDVGTQ